VTVAFVLGGGGNLGAVQVGMLLALVDAGIRPDLVVGCSVGAMNGAAFAAEPTRACLDRLERLWTGLDGRDVLPSSRLATGAALLRTGPSVHSLAGLRAVVEAFLTVRSFADLAVPFQCVATDLGAAAPAWFADGPLVDALLASAAVPAVYPPVDLGGRRYADGAVVDDVPVGRAAELGADLLYVLTVGTVDRPRRPPRRPLDAAVAAYWVARRHRLRRELAALPAGVRAVVLPTGDPPPIRPNDFTRSAELIARAREAATAALAGRA
jgi:NTE family protein